MKSPERSDSFLRPPPGSHPQDVQEKHAERSTSNERAARGGWKDDARHVFVLNSSLMCDLCGSAVSDGSGTGRDCTRRFNYTCVAQKRIGKRRCSRASIPAKAIEDAIPSRLKTFGIADAAMNGAISKADAGKEVRRRARGRCQGPAASLQLFASRRADDSDRRDSRALS
ncbi:hypothetical protein GC173_05000 [bacterium]|nr:hypothetical protein [bacterium]